MTISLSVFEADNTTIVDDVLAGQFRSLNFRDGNSAAGSWTVILPALIDDGAGGFETNPAIALFTIGRIVRFSYSPDDEDMPVERFAGVIEDSQTVQVAPDEEGGEGVTITGRGLPAIFDKVRVRPDAGLDNLPFHPTRWFNFAADRLRDDDAEGPQGIWPLAYGQLPNYDTDNYFGRPEGFVDTAGPDGDGPEWLWEDDTRTAFADAGVVYFRQRFTLDAEADIEFQFAADDEGELWVDDVPVCQAEGVYLGGCVKGTVRLSAGDHLVATLGRNLNGLRAGVVYAAWTVTDGMPDTLVMRSDSTAARCLAYPADPPGFTPGEVVRLVVDESQDLSPARLADVTFSFISASDTDSAEFSEVVDITCHAPGDSILTLLEMLGETYLDWSVSADSLEVNAWIRGTRGSDLSASVVFEKGNCRRVTEEITGSERATVALVSGSRFAPFEVVHADAAIFDIYEEVALDFGDASRASAEKFATEYLNLVSQARKGTTLELVPGVGPVPYEDFGIGDTVSVMGQDRRVAAIGLSLGADSITRWTVDLDQPRMLLEERLGALMRRQLPGSAGGRTLLPAPTTPQFVQNQAGSEYESPGWDWKSDLGDVQLYKNGVAITGAVVSGIVDPGDSNTTSLTDDEREFVKDSDVFTITVGGSTNHSPPWKPSKGRWVQAISVTSAENEDGTDVTVTLMVA